MKYTADQFTAMSHTTAEQKAKFANQFVKFVGGGFDPQQFPKWFYTELSNCFGHIAHYNQGGFYNAQFSDVQRRLQCVQDWLAYPCYGQAAFTHCDVERVLIEWLRENDIAGMLSGVAARELQEAELAELARLQRKYALQEAA